MAQTGDLKPRLTVGLLQVYTGDGKGKTTAALGLALRALGAGLRVAFLQFLKGGLPTSEQAMVSRLAPRLWLARFADEVTPFSLGRGAPSAEDVLAVARAWEITQRVIDSGAWDVLVLDEINNVVAAGLLAVDELLAALARRPEGLEVVCTGRGAPAELIAAADLVTEMKCIKHPYELGLVARSGIEH